MTEQVEAGLLAKPEVEEEHLDIPGLYQSVFEEHASEADPSLLPQEIHFGVAPSRYPEVLVRESAALGAATLLVGAIAVVIVRKRRPQ